MKRSYLFAVLLVIWPAYHMEANMHSKKQRTTEQVTITPPESTESVDIALLGDMELSKGTTGWANHPSRNNLTIDGNPITLRDTVYTSGAGTHASSKIIVKLNGATRFVSRVGIDDEVAAASNYDNRYGTANYKVTLKGEDNSEHVMAEGYITAVDPTTHLIDIDTNGWKYLILESTAGELNWGDHVDWANAYFEYYARAATAPTIVSEEEITSPFVCATEVFSQPGVRFMHKLKASSTTAQLSVENLPEGLTWNAARNLVEGIINTEGNYTYTAVATEGTDRVRETIRLTVSSSLQQPVPLMGWLSWNVYKGDINEEKIKATADAMIRYKLNDYGYQYLCIDDNWHAASREAGTNKPLYSTTKFPNGLKSLTDYAHNLGLKVGIYSDAAEQTCNKEFGSYGYEEIDAKQYAEWGFDLLKYDYCYAPGDVETAQARYTAMGNALKNCGRDILFYMCEWGQRDPWKWATSTGATCWRATYDSRDIWDAGRYDGSSCGAIQAIDIMKHLAAYAGPNRFNDADMMCVGLYGKKSPASEFSGTAGMTVTEYQSQFSMWCMFASPLTLSFDLTNISDQDLEIITNGELIAINQDRMGQQANLISSTNGIEIYSKDLENGDIALAVLNRNSTAKTVSVNFATLPLESGKEYDVRDLWAHKSMGTFTGSYSTTVASHETKVYRISPALPSGIQAVTDKSGKLSVKPTNNGVTVHYPGTAGISKRILVSDLAGRIVAQATSTAEEIHLPFNAENGIYIASIVAAGHSQAVRFHSGK